LIDNDDDDDDDLVSFLLQTHLMKTPDPLRPIAVVKEGKENKEFLSALAA